MSVRKIISNDDKATIAIVLLFCLTNSFFNYKPLVLSSSFENIVNLMINACYIFVFFKYCLRHQSSSISKYVAAILIMFAFSLLYPSLYWNQSTYYTFRIMGRLYPLCFYFLFVYFGVSLQQIKKAIIILAVLYGIVELVGISTFPHNIWGYSDFLTEEAGDVLVAQRGVVRLSVPGADFIVFTIFIVLTQFKECRKYYILLVPLFILLIMRGTRTPLLVALIMTVVYIIAHIKRKFLTASICALAFFTYQQVYEMILNSDSDNIIVKYVQLTENQMNEGSEDIRWTMTKYFFTEFNKTFLQDITGNGINAVGVYADKIKSLGENRGFCITDVLPTNIFLYFGVVGLVLYTLLFVSVLRTKMSPHNQYGKMMVIYMYLIGPTNVALLSISPMIFAMALYAVHIGKNKL